MDSVQDPLFQGDFCASEDDTALINDAYANDDFWFPPSLDHSSIMSTDSSHRNHNQSHTLETSRSVEYPSYVTDVCGRNTEHASRKMPPLEQRADWMAPTTQDASDTLFSSSPHGPSEAEWPADWNRMLPHGSPNPSLMNPTGMYASDTQFSSSTYGPSASEWPVDWRNTTLPHGPSSETLMNPTGMYASDTQFSSSTYGPPEAEWPADWNRTLPHGSPNPSLMNPAGMYVRQGLSNVQANHAFVPCPRQETYPTAHGMLKGDGEPIAVHGLSYGAFVPPVAKAPTRENPVKLARGPRQKSSKGRKRKASPDSPVPSLTAYNFYFRVEQQRLIADALKDDNGTVGTTPLNDPHPFAWIVTQSREFQDSVLNDQWGRDPQAKRKHSKTHGQISFTSLTSKISKSWKVLPTDIKDVFHEIAARDHNRLSVERRKLLPLQVVEG